VPLSWVDKGAEAIIGPCSRSTFKVHSTAWSKGLDVTAGGQGIVSHAGVVLLRALADRTGLTGGLSKALARRGFLPLHDRGRVLTDLAGAIADGATVISDFAVLAGQGEVLGPVASVPTVWRALEEIAGGGTATARRVTAGGLEMHGKLGCDEPR
jgi:hypothetical protein